MTTLVLRIQANQITMLYNEDLDLSELGAVQISRASHVEPDAQGRWWADMSPSGGGLLGPFNKRSQALEAEVAWLLENRI